MPSTANSGPAIETGAVLRPSNTGRFTINGLPPGEYYVCALTDVENNRLATPEYLEPVVFLDWIDGSGGSPPVI